MSKRTRSEESPEQNWAPKFESGSRGDLTLSFSEYLGDLSAPATTAFTTLMVIPVNPGLASSFPVLSRFASNFTEYEFEQCTFKFKSLVTEGNATAAGSVMLAPVYNGGSAPLPDKRSLVAMEGSANGKVTSNLVCNLQTSGAMLAFGGRRYVRTSPDAAMHTKQMHDVGFIQVASEHVPLDTQLGELWCTYTVHLSKLAMAPPPPLPISPEPATPPPEPVPEPTTGALIVTEIPDTDGKANALIGPPTMLYVGNPTDPELTFKAGEIFSGGNVTITMRSTDPPAIPAQQSIGGWRVTTRVIDVEAHGVQHYLITAEVRLLLEEAYLGTVPTTPPPPVPFSRLTDYLDGVVGPGGLSVTPLAAIQVVPTVNSTAVWELGSTRFYVVGESGVGALTHVPYYNGLTTIATGSPAIRYMVPLQMKRVLTVTQTGVLDLDITFNLISGIFPQDMHNPTGWVGTSEYPLDATATHQVIHRFLMEPATVTYSSIVKIPDAGVE